MKIFKLKLWSVGLLIGMSGSVACADDVWSITTTDFKTQSATLSTIDDSSVRISQSDGQQTAIVLDQFLSAERSTPPRKVGATLLLELTTGDRIRGTPISVVDEKLTWQSDLLGKFVIPLGELRAITAGASSESPIGKPPTQDVVQLANGDAVAGIITDMNASVIIVNSSGTPTDVRLDSIRSVRFAISGKVPAMVRGFRIRADDDSAIRVSSLKMSNGKLTIQTNNGGEMQLDADHVVGIEQVNGPVVWLSSRSPSENVQTSLFETTWPARFDRNVLGDSIRFKDHVYARGIGVHSYSRLVFPLDGSHKKFRTQFAIDGDMPWADVTVRIKSGDAIVHEEQHVRAGVISPVVSIDLGDAKTLTLEVDYGGSGDVQDRFNWIEPALLAK